MNIIIAEAAYDDLDHIYAWVAKDGGTAADAVVNRILVSTKRLGNFPHIGHSGKTAETYEWIVPGLPYVVVYKLQPAYNVVIVVAFFHCARDR
ncbi:MAG: type II toxin-antitoxin system RelE/ParE family toxin [Patescibacteria group bacterium]